MGEGRVLPFPKRDKVAAEPLIYSPTPNQAELFKQAFKDEGALALFEAATAVPGQIFPEYQEAFYDHVQTSYGLNHFEAKELFSRLARRKQALDGEA